MLTKAVVLIVIGMTAQGENPKAVQAGSFGTVEDCQKAGQALMAAAIAGRYAPLVGICVQTPFPFNEKGA